jgi:hypothetical protein
MSCSFNFLFAEVLWFKTSYFTNTSSTSFMVGREEGIVPVQIKPSLKITSISFKYGVSLISFSRQLHMVFPSCIFHHAHSARLPWSPPSCASRPVVSSRRTTPKLYTSTFSFTFLEYPHSGESKRLHIRTSIMQGL